MVNLTILIQRQNFRNLEKISLLRSSPLLLNAQQRRRYARPRQRLGTNYNTSNPSTNIANVRREDPLHFDQCSRLVWRPRLIESIIPPYLLPEKEVPPWPYREKGYKKYHFYLDWTTKRFDENTRIVVIEGNLGTGCDEFGRKLAERLGFHFIPQPRIEDVLIDSYGIDKRNYYHLLPEKYCLLDTEMFFTAPDHPMVNSRQFYLFLLKIEAYCNALAHLMNTGQGVVLVRSAFSDNAFVRAMYSKGYLSDDFVNLYHERGFRRDALFQLKFMPHIVLYLNAPPSWCIENIRKRGRPWEVDTKVFDYSYISTYEKEMKANLDRLAKDCEVIEFDWTDPPEMEAVLDEIYNTDLTFDWNEDDKFRTWQQPATEYYWNLNRHDFTMKTRILIQMFKPMPFIREVSLTPDDQRDCSFVMHQVIGKYHPGFNLSRGDSFRQILFPQSTNTMTGKNWQEYVMRNQFFTPCNDRVTSAVYSLPPDIPDEEYLPRRFDPQCLKFWNHH